MIFLAGDESLRSSGKSVYGFVCSSESKYTEFESGLLALRIRHKLWGEIKLQKLGSATEEIFLAYCDFIDLFLDTDEINYYSIVYGKPDTSRLRLKGYSKEYISSLRDTYHGRMIFLIARHIAEKLHEAGISEGLHLVGDESTSLNKEWSIINDLMQNKSNRVKQSVEACTFGNSAVCGYIQVADLVTGLICGKCNSKLNDNQAKLLAHIEERLGYEIGLNDPVSFSRWGNRKVNTWHFRPSPRF